MGDRFPHRCFVVILIYCGACIAQKLDSQQANVSVNYHRGEFVLNFQGKLIESLKVKRSPRETVGEPWPLPQHYKVNDRKLFKINPVDFNIRIKNHTCDILEKAIIRYKKTIFESASGEYYDNLQNADNRESITKSEGEENIYQNASTIRTLIVFIRSPCSSYPKESSDESYSIHINLEGAFLVAVEIWGALRGLETFSQLLFTRKDQFFIKETTIQDYPRFRHRGILIDTARHYMRKDVIFDVLEGMAQNKMNVLHWHIVDDQSFPYQSKVFPRLSEKGAYHPSKIYSHQDIEEIIAYARYRGIRVMPEFDVPGHSYSWGLGYPELLAQCYRGGKAVPAFHGPMDPSKNYTYDFLNEHFDEVFKVFQDRYVHLGGDEVPMDCWQSNTDIVKFVSHLLFKNSKIAKPSRMLHRVTDAWKYFTDRYPTSDLDPSQISQAWNYFTNRLTKDLISIAQNRSTGVRFVMWEEVWKNNIPIPKDTIIQVWMGNVRQLQRVVDSGHQAIYSTCWYIDHIPYGVHWPKYYQCDPGSIAEGFRGNEKMILGGEACLWSEFVTSETLISLLWPRASAVAERLWSNKNVIDINAAGPRLQEHRCRMLRRGLKVGYINGPDYCLSDRNRIQHTEESESDIVSGEFLQLQNLALLFRRPALSMNCNNELVVFSVLFSVLGMCIVIFFFGLRLKAIIRLISRVYV